MLIASGELSIHLPEQWMKAFVEERLALDDGTIVTQFKTGQDVHKITSWIAEGADLLVVEIESSSPLPDFEAALTTPARPDGLEPQLMAADGEAALTTVGLSKQRATSLLLQTLPGTVAVKSAGKCIEIRLAAGGKNRLTLLVANPVVRAKQVTAEDAIKEARRLIDKARQEGMATLRKTHDAWWHGFWAKSSILMHSDDGLADYLENLHNLFLYWMAGMSRGPDARSSTAAITSSATTGAVGPDVTGIRIRARCTGRSWRPTTRSFGPPSSTSTVVICRRSRRWRRNSSAWMVRPCRKR